MQQFMGLNNRGHFRQKILNPLIKGGLLKMTLPDKPTSRNQKYYSNRYMESSSQCGGLYFN